MSNSHNVGLVRADEAYTKQELMTRLGISQKFWDKMLNEGLPVALIGHSKWVTGQSVIDYIVNNSKKKEE
jgi:hypothetical protein